MVTEADHWAPRHDGYASDPAAECSALLDESAKHGNDPAVVARRPMAGQALLAERFGAHMPVVAAASDTDFNALRAHAAAEARRLWTRMAG